MIDSYLEELRARLAAVGVRGTAAERVLDEARDHLLEAAARSDPELAVRSFGTADAVARMVAAELATTRTRRATLGAFGALAVVGASYVLLLGLVPAAGGWPDLFGGHVGALGPPLALAMALLPQIAFVSGCLALAGALRVRRAPVVADVELRLLRRRSLVAVVAGAGAIVALTAFAVGHGEVLAAWWTWTVVTAGPVLLVLLGLAVVGVQRSSELAAAPGGRAGDVFDDLAPLFRLGPVGALELPDHPWRFAAACAGAVGLVGFAGGAYLEGGAGPGVVRGGFEAVALLACFALLGRPLGLRRSPT